MFEVKIDDKKCEINISGELGDTLNNLANVVHRVVSSALRGIPEEHRCEVADDIETVLSAALADAYKENNVNIDELYKECDEDEVNDIVKRAEEIINSTKILEKEKGEEE